MRRTRFAAALAALSLLALAGCESDPLHPTALLPGAATPRSAVAPATQAGKWSPLFAWPTIAAHLTVLPDGRVLSWTSNDLDHTHHTPNVYLWDPAVPAAFTQVPNSFTDVFCAAHSFLPDGKLLIMGGHITDVAGSKDANIFNYQGATWGRVAQMRAGRWYPTSAMMGNGEVAVVAGADEHHEANLVPEVWDGSKFRLLPGAPLEMPWYPWMFLGPDGRLFVSGPDADTRYLNPAGDGEWTTYGRTVSGVYRDYGTSVLYAPGKVLIIGGGDPPVSSAEVVDLNAGTGWQPTGSMQYARRQFNATVMADGKVLVTGGSSAPGFNTESGAVLPAEVWDPATGGWTTLASLNVPRQYHSTAVLLPDARVLVAGGGRCGTCQVNHEDAELFSPPYLFNADGTAAVRPTITSAPAAVDPGQALTVSTPDAASIARVTLVRLPSTTHGFNMNQGFTTASFTAASGAITVVAPANRNLVPGGHYMLFVINASGVPSVAKIVQLRGTAPLPAPPAAPAAPTALVASPGFGPQINLQWADNSTSEATFRIERCQGAGCSSFAEIATVEPNTTTYADGGLTAGVAYSYRVRAASSSGFSSYSNSSGATVSSAVTVVNRLSGRCMEVPGVSHVNLTQLTIWDCHGGENQLWKSAPVGTAGEIRVYGDKCLDGFGAEGGGTNGDRIIIYDCHGGANQQWTRTSAAEIRNFNGSKCVELLNKATGNATELVLWNCDGSASQKWDSQGGGAVDQPPVAKFTHGCTGLTCNFDSSPSTDDKGIASRSWTFGATGVAPSTAVAPAVTYPAAGTYTVTLTVTDAAGQSNSTQQSVVVTAPANQPPTASFTFTCTGLACAFTNASSDADGSVTGWSWSFGDGSTSSAQHPSRTYAAAGSYTVTLTATDDRGATGTATKTVTVAAPSAISLTVRGYKDKGIQRADLAWSGASTSTVDVYRNDAVVARPPSNTTTKSGAYTDNINRKGSGTYRYKVCDAASTTVCSGEVTVIF